MSYEILLLRKRGQEINLL